MLNPAALRVLVVDDDATICHILDSLLRREGYETEIVHDGEAALGVMSGATPPPLVLLDWVLPGVSGIEVCRSLRARPQGTHPYIFMMSSRQSEEDMLACFDAGVDEFIPKPFDLQILIARLKSAERRLMGDMGKGPSGLPQLLRGLSPGSTGELIARCHDRTGHIIVHGGKIAWIHITGRDSLLSVLVKLGVSEGDLKDTLEECRVSRVPFMDTLVAWDLVSRPRLERALRSELASRLNEMLAAPGCNAFFVPKNVPFESSFMFELSELDSPPASTPAPPSVSMRPMRPREVPREFELLLDTIASTQGIESVALLEPASGQVLSSRGSDCDLGLPRRMMRALSATQGELVEETLVMSDSHYHLIGRLDPFDVYVRARRSLNPNIGLVRFAVSQTRTNRGNPGPAR